MSHQMPDRETAISTARGLTAALSGMADELKAVNDRQDRAEATAATLVTYGRRNRHLIRLTFASIVLDVILTVLLVFVYGSARNSSVEAHNARAVASAQHSNLIAACRLSNESRAASIQLWDHIAAISKKPKTATKAQAAAEQHKLKVFLAYVGRVYAPRNCVQLYRLPPGKP